MNRANFLKKYFFAIALFTGNNIVNGQTNVYHPFPDTDAVWTVHDGHAGSAFYCTNGISEWDRSYIQNGDTIINTVQYNKLFLNEHHWEYWLNPSCFYDYGTTLNVFVGGLRNDSANKKVYYYDATLNQECLLYDFSVNVGDSIQEWGSNCSGLGYYYHILSIDSVLVGIQYHKRFNIDGGFNADTSIIEGIGSLTGLLGPYFFFENFNQLHCFQELNQTMFVNPNCFCTCSIVGVDELKNHDLRIEVYPNPFNSVSKLIANFSFKNASIQLYNIFGKLVKEFNNIYGIEFTLTGDKLNEGVYFLKVIQDNEKILIQKILILK